jgi:hypothetical protein
LQKAVLGGIFDMCGVLPFDVMFLLALEYYQISATITTRLPEHPPSFAPQRLPTASGRWQES